MRVVLAMLVLILAAGAADGAGEAYAGRPLAEILDELREEGLSLIYSSDVVTSDLIVRTEPRARAPRKAVAELLAPFGLDATDPAFWQQGLGVIAGLLDELVAMDGEQT